MTFHHHNDLRYLTFQTFADLPHGVFTRHGGVSSAPWSTLNVGGSVGDDIDHVRENRIRSFAALNRERDSLHDVWLVHGTNVIFADQPRDLSLKSPQADLLFTNNPNVTLFMRFADCVPLLFHDPKKGVIGISHAGWMGTVKGVATASIAAMKSRYGTDPRDVRAAIGPSIGPDHYEVGTDVAEHVRASFGKRAESLLEPRGAKFHLDLWSANRLQLEEAGVCSVEIAQVCTACHLEDWFSHRAEKGRTGRFGVLLSL
ncbi:MAG: Polyphenol oxidase [Anaerolineales bacterium]|nr:Polyphenol oxidase [Anaerolineales bacterium]